MAYQCHTGHASFLISVLFMKIKISFLILFLFSVARIQAQSFANNDNVAGLSVGLGGGYGFPIAVSYERGVYDINNHMSIGVGGIVGYGFNSDKFQYGKVVNNHILLGARGAWHYTKFSKWDLYAGLTLGYNIVSSKVTYDDPNINYDDFGADASGFLWGAHVGARYYFNPKFAVMAELGYGIGIINIGVAYKF